MRKSESLINGVIKLKGKVFEDERGYFYEKYNQEFLNENHVNFLQENISKSLKGTIRGIHWQINPNAQDKLVTCISGEIYDVAVDLRRSSKTFGQYCSQILKGGENLSLWIPKGFAHGFQALTDNCIISYSVSGIYSKSDSRTINPTCKYLGIEWPIEDNIISENDSKAFSLGDMLDQEIFFK